MSDLQEMQTYPNHQNENQNKCRKKSQYATKKNLKLSTEQHLLN